MSIKGSGQKLSAVSKPRTCVNEDDAHIDQMKCSEQGTNEHDEMFETNLAIQHHLLLFHFLHQVTRGLICIDKCTSVQLALSEPTRTINRTSSTHSHVVDREN